MWDENGTGSPEKSTDGDPPQTKHIFIPECRTGIEPTAMRVRTVLRQRLKISAKEIENQISDVILFEYVDSQNRFNDILNGFVIQYLSVDFEISLNPVYDITFDLVTSLSRFGGLRGRMV